MQLTTKILLAAFAATLAAAAATAPAASGTSGTLRAGGTARGDISKSAGDEDTISIDLLRGCDLAVTWRPGFTASFTFSDPGGNPLDLGIDGARGGSVKAWPVPASGTYTFRIASADGSQGFYSLTALPAWPKSVVLTGSGDTTLDVAMPASSSVKGKVQALPGAGAPVILSFRAPDGSELLVNPVTANGATAKLPTVVCATPGVYRLQADATQGTQDFQATLKRKVPRVARESLLLENGIDPISFEGDGVSTYFAQKCASCHDWARSYAGCRSFAKQSLGRIRTGNMPKSGPRASAADIALLTGWIQTGFAH